MRAGLLSATNETLSFKELIEVTSLSGFVKKEYISVLTCKAYRMKLSASAESVNAMEQFTGRIIVFQVRCYPTIKENQRVEYQGQDYSITLLDRQRDNTYLATLTKIDKRCK